MTPSVQEPPKVVRQAPPPLPPTPPPVVKQVPTAGPTPTSTATSATAADYPPLPPPARAPSGQRPLTPAPGTSAVPPAELHRRRPIGPPGANLVDLLKRKEEDPTNPLRL